MEPIDIRKEVKFNREGVSPNFLYISDKMRVPLLCLEAGQEIPAHASAEGLFYVIQGTGIFTLGEEKTEISPGTLIIAPAGTIRGIKSKDRLVVVAVQAF